MTSTRSSSRELPSAIAPPISTSGMQGRRGAPRAGGRLEASALRSTASGRRPSRCAARPSSPPARAGEAAGRRWRCPRARPRSAPSPAASARAASRSTRRATSGAPSGVGYWNGDCPMRRRRSRSGAPPSVRAPVARSAEATSVEGPLQLRPSRRGRAELRRPEQGPERRPDVSLARLERNLPPRPRQPAGGASAMKRRQSRVATWRAVAGWVATVSSSAWRSRGPSTGPMRRPRRRFSPSSCSAGSNSTRPFRNRWRSRTVHPVRHRAASITSSWV